MQQRAAQTVPPRFPSEVHLENTVQKHNPKTNPNARRIPHVTKIDESVHALAGGAGSSLGTGGMATKIRAAEITMEQKIPCCIISGDDPAPLYDLLDGADIGTVFAAE